jgi:amino acid transporter
MLELWNNWYDTLASVEALATVVVIVLVAAGLLRWRKVGGDKRVRQKIDLGETSANRSFRPA